MMEIPELKITRYCCMYNDCGKYYTTKFNLKIHIETTHLHYKKYKCDNCDQSFSYKKNLVEHAYLHTGAKPYQCSICEKSFRHLSLLCFHRRTHRSKGCIDMMEF